MMARHWSRSWWPTTRQVSSRPLGAIADVVRRHDALLLVDAVQAAGKLPLGEIDADMMTLSGHKDRRACGRRRVGTKDRYGIERVVARWRSGDRLARGNRKPSRDRRVRCCGAGLLGRRCHCLATAPGRPWRPAYWRQHRTLSLWLAMQNGWPTRLPYPWGMSLPKRWSWPSTSRALRSARARPARRARSRPPMCCSPWGAVTPPAMRSVSVMAGPRPMTI